MSKTFTAPITGPLTVAVHADVLLLDVITDPGAATASIELTGPAAVVDRARTELAGTRWTLTLPRAPVASRTVIHSSATVISAGTFTGSVIMTGGRVYVDGVDVTAATWRPGPEPLQAVIRLPEGASLAAHVDHGRVRIDGQPRAVLAETVSADLVANAPGALDASSVSGDITIASSGPAQLRTVSGDITLRHADGAVTAETTSGDIAIHATSTVAIHARAISGDVRVTAAPGARPAVTARSVSGDVRTC